MSRDRDSADRATPERTALARFRHVAGQVSQAMSLGVLLSPIVLMLLPDSRQLHPLVRPMAPREPASPAITAVRPPTRSATAPATTVPAPAPLIPIIEVKVRRETNPRLDISAPRESVAPPLAPPPPATVGPPPPADGASAPVGTDVTSLLPLPPLPPAWTDVEVQSALRACLTTLAPLQAALEPLPPLKENTCGLPAPVAVNRVGSDGVEFRPAAIIVNCAMASALHAWIDDVAQPAARAAFGSPIAQLEGTGGYACRNRNGAANGPISEHAFGNALDVAGFVLADGRKIGVLTHWGATASEAATTGPQQNAPPKGPSRGSAAKQVAGKGRSGAPAAAIEEPADANAGPTTGRSPEAGFLRRVHAGACGIFGTVLGPDSNAAHRDHFHFDMKVRRRTGICE